MSEASESVDSCGGAWESLEIGRDESEGSSSILAWGLWSGFSRMTEGRIWFVDCIDPREEPPAKSVTDRRPDSDPDPRSRIKSWLSRVNL